MAGETPTPAVEIGEGGKLQLNEDARAAFADKAQFVENALRGLNDQVADSATANWFAKARGKLTVKNAAAVRQEVVARLSAVIADLPARLAEASDETSRSIARFETLEQLQAIIRDEINAFIQRAILNPDSSDSWGARAAKDVKRWRSGSRTEEAMAAIDREMGR